MNKPFPESLREVLYDAALAVTTNPDGTKTITGDMSPDQAVERITSLVEELIGFELEDKGDLTLAEALGVDPRVRKYYVATGHIQEKIDLKSKVRGKDE